MEGKGEVVIYENSNGSTAIEVRLQEETVWLNQHQLTVLFNRDQSVISRHIKNVFAEGELDEKSNMHFLHIANSDKPTAFYNLNVIISVGYRIKSKQGTQFRIWATQTLKDHLVKGYTLNEKRLKEQQEKFKELHQTVEFLKTTLGTKNLSGNETQGLLEIISKYTRSFVLLNQFDSNSLEVEPSDKKLTHEIKYKEALAAIEQLKKKLIAEGEASELFGRQREDVFSGILDSVVQTFGGEYLYPGIEEQAAHLLYFVIKNHPFADGNKRIGAFLFVWFLHLNQHLLKKEGEAKINDNALVALALLIASLV
jgi:prophage maintenance system killer protein